MPRPPVFDGGTPADHEQLLAIHQKYLTANDPLDSEMLKEIWSHDPDNAFFNSNGHTYIGLTEWLALWDYLRPQFTVEKA